MGSSNEKAVTKSPGKPPFRVDVHDLHSPPGEEDGYWTDRTLPKEEDAVKRAEDITLASMAECGSLARWKSVGKCGLVYDSTGRLVYSGWAILKGNLTPRSDDGGAGRAKRASDAVRVQAEIDIDEVNSTWDRGHGVNPNLRAPGPRSAGEGNATTTTGTCKAEPDSTLIFWLGRPKTHLDVFEEYQAIGKFGEGPKRWEEHEAKAVELLFERSSDNSTSVIEAVFSKASNREMRIENYLFEIGHMKGLWVATIAILSGAVSGIDGRVLLWPPNHETCSLAAKTLAQLLRREWVYWTSIPAEV